MKTLSALLTALLVILPGCASLQEREVRPQREVDIDIQEDPCVIAISADGEFVFNLDATEYGLTCLVRPK